VLCVRRYSVYWYRWLVVATGMKIEDIRREEIRRCEATNIRVNKKHPRYP